jgi:Zn-dependent metalloprotease
MLAVAARSASAQPRPATIAAADPASLRTWDTAVDGMLRSGDLTVRRADIDTLVDGRVHTRLQQLYHGVPVVGASLTRQTDGIGVTVSIFGTTYPDIAIDATPALTVEQATAIIAAASGVDLGPAKLPTLVILPAADGYHLAYRARVFTADAATDYFIDANTGAMLKQTDAAQRQAAVGSGTGVLGDPKKVSVAVSSGVYIMDDLLRPPTLTTFDMKGNLQRVNDFLNNVITLGIADHAADSDNVWTDPALVDAHAYSGYFYDFYFRRFGRRGLDNNNFRMLSLVHPAPRAAVLSQTDSVIGNFYLNAFYAGDGIMVYGEGLPTSLMANGQHWNYLSGALDIVAHELTHGVTDFTSQLLYENESGALNESFSDMMGTSVEFFYQPAGSGLQKADYLIGEDVVTPGGLRSMENPASYGQPDHYANRVILPLSNDNGGVHTNSGISNQVYYLAIEGGTNRTSHLTVQGVGSANRDQIEKTMYRAFTQLMPSNATFSVARAVTIQAATDLYGSSSACVRALTQAWNAVGVN